MKRVDPTLGYIAKGEADVRDDLMLAGSSSEALALHRPELRSIAKKESSAAGQHRYLPALLHRDASIWIGCHLAT